jgi:hypothetical protein
MGKVQQLTPEDWARLLFDEANGWVNVFAIDKVGRKTSKWGRSAKEIGEHVESLRGQNVWLGCATRKERLEGTKRGSRDECLEVPGVWVDLDIKGEAHDEENLPPDLESAVALLKDFPHQPTVVLHSGNGLQAWWLFEELSSVTDPEFVEFLGRWEATWKELSRRRGWAIDDVFDVARIMRIPGTENHKSVPPKPVVVRHFSPDLRWTIDRLDEYTVEAPKVEKIERPVYDGPERIGDKFNREADIDHILTKHGCVFDHADRDGTRHYRAPHRADQPGVTGVVTYPDRLTTIYSQSWARSTGLEHDRPYDAFGLVACLEHGGSFEAATVAYAPPDIPWSEILPTAPAVSIGNIAEPQPLSVTKLVTGWDFLFNDVVEMEIRWGQDADVLWAAGESLMICGPPGVGKTTLAHQLVVSLLGLREDVLGYPVNQSQRILYLAMDRPRQIRRALRRLVGPEAEKELKDRLIVHPGPMISDLKSRPELILETAIEAGADVVFVDSLKDAAVKLSEDETGGQVNRAVQLCNARDVDVCVLHHQRKGQNGEKPNKLEDVYGSIWLTAGTGSVIVLWGEAGSENVELLHLKQPVDTVGPLLVQHDHIIGISTVVKQFDPLAYLKNRGPQGCDAQRYRSGGERCRAECGRQETHRPENAAS